jgi:WD40 repeat protein
VRQFDLEQTKVQRPPGPEGPTPESGPDGGIWRLAFADESTLYTAGGEGTGVLRWELETGTWERILSAKPGQTSSLWLSGDRQRMITRIQSPPPYECGPGERTPLVLHDLRTGAGKNLTTVVECGARSLAFDTSLTVYVTGQADGTLRVGRVGGDEPHLLAGHEGRVPDLAISPDLQWIASAGEDNTLRLWPMPDLDKPPLHTLPHDELIAKLKLLTNIGVVRDPESAEGWKVEIGPFPGWKEVPTW